MPLLITTSRTSSRQHGQDPQLRMDSQKNYPNSTTKKNFNNKVQDMTDPMPDQVIQVNYNDIDNKLRGHPVDPNDEDTAAQSRPVA